MLIGTRLVRMEIKISSIGRLTQRASAGAAAFIAHSENRNESTIGKQGRMSPLFNAYIRLLIDHPCSMTILWQPHAVSWSQLFGNRAQDGATTLQKLIRDRAESYCTRIKNSPEIPEDFKHVFCSSAYKVQNISGEYTATLLQAVSRYQEAGDQIRQETREWLIELMSDAYSDAQKATGK